MVLGIVCEYNPFHNGHLYQLQKSREAAGEDAVVICVLSGDFVQRGEAAAFDKFSRAEAACRCGADLVVELPLPWCLSSAEGFARGSVGLLSALGAERLCFGSESGETGALERLAQTLLEPDFIDAVKGRLSADGALSFAAARQLEAWDRLGETAALLEKPNDILAVEYCKAIRSLGLAMEPVALRRFGAGHDSLEAGGNVCSASLLRQKLAGGEGVDAFVPAPAAEVFCREQERGRALCDPAALETALLSRLRSLEEDAFRALPDAGGGLGNRLYRAVREQGSIADAVKAAATKRYPAARARRALLCACLGIRAGMADGVPPYARLLAASGRGRAHLRSFPGETALPLLTKPAAVRELSAECEALFTLTAAAHDLYVLGFTGAENRRPGEDWRTGPYLKR